MTDWTNCTAVERNPRKVGVDLALEGIRVPVYALFENLESGATVKEFLEWYPDVKEWQVTAVIKHEAELLEADVQALGSVRPRDSGTSRNVPQGGDGSCWRTGS